MKVAILQCDDILDKFQPSFNNYPQMIVQLLNRVEQSIDVETFDVRKEEYPNTIDEWDCFITTGSKSSVYDEEPWIKTLVTFVQQLDKAEKKLIGICFGHQIIALAKGGKVKKSGKGWGIGIASNRMVANPEWMEGKHQQLNIIVSHQDQVYQLPKEAQVIAESDFCPFFMVQWNQHFLSIQGHPEWHTDYSAALINHRRNIIPHERVEEGLASLDKEPDNDLFAQWIFKFLLI